MNEPLFSIVTITFNAAETLPATLRSVDSQTFTDYEHLIIDGASKDSTVETARKAANKRRAIYSEPDKGLYDAMNKGLSKARGRFIVFLNAGDSFSTPGTLALYAQAATDGTDIIYADVGMSPGFLRAPLSGSRIRPAIPFLGRL